MRNKNSLVSSWPSLKVEMVSHRFASVWRKGLTKDAKGLSNWDDHGSNSGKNRSRRRKAEVCSHTSSLEAPHSYPGQRVREVGPQGRRLYCRCESEICHYR